VVGKRSPLFMASEAGQLEVATYLAQRFEVDPNIQCEEARKTALFAAAERGHTAVVEELVRRHDIEVNRMTSGRKTALYVAVERGYKDCVKHILKRCKLADLYLETSFSTTPLYIA
jgi:ankyrin repeat protein